MRSIQGGDTLADRDEAPRIGLVTGNSGKFREIKAYTDPLGIETFMAPSGFIEIQADTLEEVVLYGLKDYVARNGEGAMYVKDDSGLFVDALDGFPGVYSAYALKTISNEGILRLMADAKDRSASFRTAMGLYVPGEGISIFRGETRGRIAFSRSGKMGFGFDPIFIPEGMDETFADMTLEVKNTMSHRIKALRGVIQYLSARSV